MTYFVGANLFKCLSFFPPSFTCFDNFILLFFLPFFLLIFLPFFLLLFLALFFYSHARNSISCFVGRLVGPLVGRLETNCLEHSTFGNWPYYIAIWAFSCRNTVEPTKTDLRVAKNLTIADSGSVP